MGRVDANTGGRVVHLCRDQADGPVTGWMIHCPGCGEKHRVKVGVWGFNGDLDRPTFTPSLLVQSGHHIPGHSGDCWCDYNAKHPEKPAPFKCSICHSFVTDGQIQFLCDSTHELAGQTVALEAW